MSQEIGGKRKVYHYLHNMASGSEDAVREGDFLIFLLPNPNWERKTEPFDGYNLRIDPRDRRTLVVFDGHIPCDGLPKQAKVVLSFPLETLRVSEGNVRQPRPEEEQPLWHVFDDGKNQATICINRYFLLLPKNRIACLRRYDNKSLRGIYTFIEITDKEVVIQPKGITWRTSSY